MDLLQPIINSVKDLEFLYFQFNKDVDKIFLSFNTQTTLYWFWKHEKTSIFPKNNLKFLREIYKSVCQLPEVQHLPHQRASSGNDDFG